MKTKKIEGLLILFLSIISTIGCNKEDEEKKTEIYQLSFKKNYYERPLIGAKSILIQGGNRDYTVKVKNSGIVEVTVDLSNPTDRGSLKILPKQKGETTVNVTDNITHETIGLTIKITDNYLVYPVNESNHPALSKGVIIYLINNEARDCYFFTYNYLEHNIYETPFAKGHYQFSVEKNEEKNPVPFLILTYTSDESGKFTHITVPPTPHKFDISNSSSFVFSVIAQHLRIDWKNMIENAEIRSEYQPDLILQMQEINTEYIIKGNMDIIPEIPEKVLE